MKTYKQVKEEARVLRPDLSDSQFEIVSRYAMLRLMNERNESIRATTRGVRNQIKTTNFNSSRVAKLTVTWAIDMLMGAYGLPIARKQ